MQIPLYLHSIWFSNRAKSPAIFSLRFHPRRPSEHVIRARRAKVRRRTPRTNVAPREMEDFARQIRGPGPSSPGTSAGSRPRDARKSMIHPSVARLRHQRFSPLVCAARHPPLQLSWARLGCTGLGLPAQRNAQLNILANQSDTSSRGQRPGKTPFRGIIQLGCLGYSRNSAGPLWRLPVGLTLSWLLPCGPD